MSHRTPIKNYKVSQRIEWENFKHTFAALSLTPATLRSGNPISLGILLLVAKGCWPLVFVIDSESRGRSIENDTEVSKGAGSASEICGLATSTCVEFKFDVEDGILLGNIPTEAGV